MMLNNRIIQLLTCFLASVLISSLNAKIYEKKSRFVNDYVGVFSVEEVVKMSEQIDEVSYFEDIDISLVVIASLTQRPKEVKVFTQKLMREWEMGKSHQGRAILITLVTEDTMATIESSEAVKGNRQVALTRLTDEILRPAVAEKAYVSGVLKTIGHLADALHGRIVIEQPAQQEKRQKKKDNSIYLLIFIGLMGLLMIFSLFFVRGEGTEALFGDDSWGGIGGSDQSGGDGGGGDGGD